MAAHWDGESFPIFPADCKLLLCKYLTREMWESLKSKKTMRGVSFSDCIRPGVENLHVISGVFAVDEEAYVLFAPLFDKVIEDFHGHKPSDTHSCDLDPSHLNVSNPDPEGKYIISTRIRVARSLRGFSLPGSITKEQRIQLETCVREALKDLTGDLKGTYYPLTDMSEDVANQLIDDHFLFQKGSGLHESAGTNRDWPEARGIYHNNEKTFLVWINEEDHMRIISMQPGCNITQVFDRLCRAVNALSSQLDFKYSEHLGFVTSCPTNLGTGIRASVHIKIPHASQQPSFKEWCHEHHLQPRGIDGEYTANPGGIFDISNKHRLGISEVVCVQQMYDGVKALIEWEKSLEGK